MREQHNVAWSQSAPVVATAAALWIAGVVALPLIFGAQPIGVASGLVWLVVALVITISVVARLLVLAGELLVIQAILRRPIAIALGGERQVATVEAGIAAGALFLILPL